MLESHRQEKLPSAACSPSAVPAEKSSPAGPPWNKTPRSDRIFVMSSESELIKATVEAAIEPFRDLIRKLAGPAFEEIGLTLQDSVKVWRFKRLIRLWQKVKEYVDEAGISPRVIPKKLLHAAVECGSLE